MKHVIKKYIPIWILRLLKKTPLASYASYKDALAICNTNGYSNRNLIEMIIEKNLIFAKKISQNNSFDESIFRTLLPIALIDKNTNLNILDFGGGGGSHYTQAKNVLNKSYILRWAVVETKELAAAAENLSSQDLQFFDDIRKAKDYLNHIDLIFANSSLPYCEEPFEALNMLLNIGAQYIFITRTPLTTSHESVVAIQTSNLSDNGPGPLPPDYENHKINYPITFMSQVKFEAALLEKYNIRLKIIETKSAYLINNENINCYGYFCSRK